MKTLEKICINCPAGCRLEITVSDDGAVSVKGNNCKRGAVYAENEVRDPRRVVTAVVRSRSETLPYVPVRTDAALPVALIPGLLHELYSLTLPAGMKAGDALIRDYAGTSVNVILARDPE